MSEIIFLAVLALIVIGPKELPELARTLGRFINELKRSTSGLTDDLKAQARFDAFNLEDTLLNSRKNPNQAPQQQANPPQPVVEDDKQMELPVQQSTDQAAQSTTPDDKKEQQ